MNDMGMRRSSTRSRRLAACGLLAVSWLLPGCESDEMTRPVIEGTIAIEVLDHATVRIEPLDAGRAQMTVTLDAGFGLAPVGTPLVAAGYAETSPETGDTLYSAQLSAPADASGPCGDEPISLALSLHRPGSNATVMGGISAYCGKERWFGVPVRVLRLAGRLPLP